MFAPGDVVRFRSPTAGKEKFHLCLCVMNDGNKNAFLHINSKAGFSGDCVFQDGEIDGLPKSPTGQSVVSFSQVVRMNESRLKLFGAVKTGALDNNLVGVLLAFAKQTKALSDLDRILVLAALDEMLAS